MDRDTFEVAMAADLKTVRLDQREGGLLVLTMLCASEERARALYEQLNAQMGAGRLYLETKRPVAVLGGTQ